MPRNRTERHAAWEILLEESVAAVAAVRIIEEHENPAVTRGRGAAVLTDSRFLVIGNRISSRLPRNTQDLDTRIRLQVPRSNITGVMLSKGKGNDIIIRWYDGNEKKIRLRPGKDAPPLLSLIQQDLSGPVS